MSEFVKLTHARFVPGANPWTGTYTAGDPVYIMPATILAIIPRGDFTWLVMGENDRHKTGVEVVESSEVIHAMLVDKTTLTE